MSDVVAEGLSPGVSTSGGGYDALRAFKSDMSYVQTVGQGAKGPKAACRTGVDREFLFDGLSRCRGSRGPIAAGWELLVPGLMGA